MIQSPELNLLIIDLSIMATRAEPDAVAVTKKSIGEVSDSMRMFVPKNTGATHDSISDEVTVAHGTVSGESGPTTRYASFIEWGTYKDAPQAFAGPALDRHSGDYAEAIGALPMRYW